MDDPHALRADMQAYLDRLLEQTKSDRDQTTRRGSTDPMMAARGQTALESAIIETRGILKSLDRILETPSAEIVTFRTTCNGLSRLPSSQCA